MLLEWEARRPHSHLALARASLYEHRIGPSGKKETVQMKRHLVWFRSAAVAAVAAAGVVASPVNAQYLPMYGATPQTTPAQAQPTAQQPVPVYPVTRQPGVAPATSYPVTAQQPVQPTQPAYVAYRPQTPTAPVTPAAQAQSYPQTGSQYSSFPTYGYPTIAQQPSTPTLPTPPQGEVLPAPASANGAPDAPMTGNAAAAPVNGNQAYQAGCSTCNSGYPTTGGSYQGDNWGCTSGGYGLSDSFESCNDNIWFGGVYYLFMERDNSDFNRLAVQIDTTAPTYPYYPPASRTVLATTDVDYGYNSGAEVRFGCTFNIGSACDSGCNSGCGTCGTCSTCAPMNTYAWEAAYWGLDEDYQMVRVVDQVPTDNYRMYGMKNFAGLQYDRDGANGTYGWRPVNDYYDYQVPVDAPTAPVDGDIRVLAQRVRTNFQAQNIELNFLRLPMICSSSCGGCGDCGGSSCGGGSACAPSCGSAFTMTGLCGMRYVRLDDDFEYAGKFGEYSGGNLDYPTYTPFDYQSDNELFYDVQVDNHLVGLQLGANLNYCVACRWNLFCDTNFGLYNNYMDSYQRVYSGGGGNVTWVNSGNEASVSSNKDDVSFLGELRLGGAYDFTCNWRGVLAYRALAVTGVALSGDQIPQDFSNSAQVGLISSDGSIIIHGIQAGVECRY